MHTPDTQGPFDAEGIAIIGMAGRFPGAPDVRAFWRLLRDGREATQWPDDATLKAAGASAADLADPHYVRATLPLEAFDCFDATFFGISPRDASVMDPQHRLFIECAWQALEDAGHPPSSFEGDIGVFGGCGLQAYFARHLLPHAALMQSMGLFLLRHTGNDKDFLTTRVSYLLNLRGPSVAVQAACSTSLVAVHLAAQSLSARECDIALAGASSLELPQGLGYRHVPGEILSPDGHCRAFDAQAGGTLFGSGCGVVVLRRLEDALADGDTVWAVLRGSAVNNDGRSKAGYLAPSVEGQVRVAAEALAVSGLSGADIDYLEAHGTGTAVGDPIELTALAQAYTGAAHRAIGLGSVKTNIGHLDTAAGIASLIKVCLALAHGRLPASLNFQRPHPQFDFDHGPFSVVAQSRPWPRAERPRAAAVHALGVGGTNAHLVLQEPPEPPARPDAPGKPDWHLFVFSARSPRALEALRRKWVDFIEQGQAGEALPAGSPVALPGAGDIEFTLQAGREPMPYRLAVVDSEVGGLLQALRSLPDLAARPSEGSRSPAPGPVAFLFPGGGAQAPETGRDLLRRPAFAEAVEALMALLPKPTGDVHGASAPLAQALREHLFQPGDASWLERPSLALPALCLFELALARLWRAAGIAPAVVLGHSAGEVAAACVAGLLAESEALQLASWRGQLLEKAGGGMLSVDASEERLRPWLEALGLDLAAVNAPDLCMVSGPLSALATLEARLELEAIDARRLRVAVAAHSRAVDDFIGELQLRVDRLADAPARLPFVSSVDGRWIQPGHRLPPDYWARHLRQPVRFAQSLQSLRQTLPDVTLLECGPGQGLSSLARHQGAGRLTVLSSTAKASAPSADLSTWLGSVGTLWSAGHPIEWPAVRGCRQGRRVSLPTYAFERQRHWIDAPARIEPPPATPTPAPDRARTAPERFPALEDWFATERWQPTGLPAPREGGYRPEALAWCLVGGDPPFAQALLQRLRATGARVTCLRHTMESGQPAPDPFRVRPGQTDDYLQALDTLAARSELPQVVVHLGALDAGSAPEGAAASGSIAGLATGFDSAISLARAWTLAGFEHPCHWLMVTAGSQAVDGVPPRHPHQALALGIVRVVPHEIPGVRATLVDLDPDALLKPDTINALLQVAQTPPGEGRITDRVAVRAGRCQVPGEQRLELPARAVPRRWRQGGCYLITGGLGGIGLALAQWLAHRWHARIALVSRRRLPPRAEWDDLIARTGASGTLGDLTLPALLRQLQAIEAEAGALQVFSADVADRAAMAKVITECGLRWGPLQGVFHAAGEIDDAPLAVKPLTDMHRLIAGKVLGAQVLDALLPDPLDVFAVCSSTSVCLGPPGQVDYVAACAALESIACRRADGLALRWGLWSDLGMAARAIGRERIDESQPWIGPAKEDGHGGWCFDSVLDPATAWVVREHRVAGQPVLPGVAYFDMARAALHTLHPHGALDLQDLVLLKALVLSEGPRRIVCRLRPQASGGFAFSVESAPVQGGQWMAHARARLQPWALPGADALAPWSVPASGWTSGKPPQADHPQLAFGPRWDTLVSVCHAGPRTAGRLRLPAQAQADLATMPLHPALLDIALTLGLPAVTTSLTPPLQVPVAVARARLPAQLPETLVAICAPGTGAEPGELLFDVQLQDDQGRVLGEISGLALRGVEAGLLAGADSPPAGASPASPASHAAPPALAHPLAPLIARGIRAQEASAVFDRTFRMPAGLVQVSSLRVADVRQWLTPEPSPLSLAAAPARSASILTAATPAAGSASASTADAALKPNEQRLAVLWRELLGVEEVAASDDFFALGGHSLLAVRLMARIRRQWGLDLPLAVLVEAPTLGQLAARLPAGTPEALTPVWSPLVRVAAGTPARRPLACVHGAGGNVLNFRLIADRLPGVPFLGLQAQGVDGRLPPLDSIEAMAAQYLRALREAVPEGPYRLAGYSAGGVIALEMACQLQAEGAQVDLLAMIDTLCPLAARASVPWWRRAWLARHWSARFALGWPDRRRRGRVMERRYAQALAALARGEIVPPDLVEFHLFRNFLQAQARYQPRPWPGDLLLFKACDAEVPYLAAGPTLGWDQWVAGRIDTVSLSGSHFTIMREPGLTQLSQGLARVLARLDGLAEGRGEPPPRQHPGDSLGDPARPVAGRRPGWLGLMPGWRPGRLRAG